MLRQGSQETRTGAESRVDQLLSVLRVALRHESPPALRTRLAQMSSDRLGGIRPARRPRTSPRRRPIFGVPAIAFIAVVLIACAAFIGLLVRDEGRHREVNRIALEEQTVPAAPRARNSEAPPSVPTQRRNWPARSRTYVGRLGDLVIPLPYSDAAVHTGTGTMIGISLSQGELLSLGVPLTPTVDDRRFIAQVILGDDGLPRAISVPLPLTVVEERK